MDSLPALRSERHPEGGRTMTDEWADEVGTAFTNPMASGGQISTFVDPYGTFVDEFGARQKIAPLGILDERSEHYGDPKPNHDRIAALWSAWVGVPVTAHDVAVMMVMVKLSRCKVAPSYGDNYVDAHGYLDIAQEMAK